MKQRRTLSGIMSQRAGQSHHSHSRGAPLNDEEASSLLLESGGLTDINKTSSAAEVSSKSSNSQSKHRFPGGSHVPHFNNNMNTKRQKTQGKGLLLLECWRIVQLAGGTGLILLGLWQITRIILIFSAQSSTSWMMNPSIIKAGSSPSAPPKYNHAFVSVMLTFAIG
jgi:hypothetical protein